MPENKVSEHLTKTGLPTSKLENGDEKRKDTKENFVDLTEKLNKLREENFYDFKKESVEKISLIEKKIIKLEEKIKTANVELGMIYQNQMDELEHTKRILEGKLDEYKEDGESEWNRFEIEFSHDLRVFEIELADFVANFKKD